MEVDECEMEVEGNSETRIKNENMPESSCDTFLSTNDIPCKTRRFENRLNSPTLKKKAVVLLTRLPDYTISAMQPPTPQQFYSETESLGSSDSDLLWEPDEDSRDSDYDISAKGKKTSKSKESVKNTAPPPVIINNNSNNSSSSSSKVKESGPIIISSVFAHSSSETTKVRPDLPEVEVTVDKVVLARKRAMRWQRGKITEILTRDDGRVKYKVTFEEKGKSLVSGHHIASDEIPRLQQLYVGARIVVQSDSDPQCFLPGILAELPSRKNRLRFLVFLDDHTSLYASLPILRLILRPLDDNLDDLPDGPHKSFMKQYLKNWPYPHLTHYKEGQSISVEVNGVFQVCTVEVVDCSLIQVFFQETGEREWIHRGTVRLEHMAKFMLLKEKEDAKYNADPQ